MRLHAGIRQRVVDAGLLDEHVLREGEDDGTGAPGRGDVERARHELGDPVGALDLRHPLGERPEHLPVVDLLEGLALHHLAADLADDQDQRRRVLKGRVHTTRRMRRARPARDHADAGPAGELAVRVRHVRRADLVPADDEPDRCVMQGVEDGQVAFAGHAECRVDAVHDELIDQNLPAGPHPVRAGGRRRRSAAAASVCPRRPGRRSGWCACRPTLQAAAARGRTPSPHSRERGVHRLGPALEPGAARAVGHGCPAVPISSSPCRRHADAGPGWVWV